jgi:hypothetical protein
MLIIEKEFIKNFNTNTYKHNASYSTGIKFNPQLLNSYKLKVLKFLNKVEEIIEY